HQIEALVEKHAPDDWLQEEKCTTMPFLTTSLNPSATTLIIMVKSPIMVWRYLQTRRPLA
ncbi:hypothetical protein N5P32_05965, partial [Marinomonas pontica]|uniref:hypothetical protein n=1 Tax=Marinomonas pontica TaxID=264739 RepID=UPI002244029A